MGLSLAEAAELLEKRFEALYQIDRPFVVDYSIHDVRPADEAEKKLIFAHVAVIGLMEQAHMQIMGSETKLFDTEQGQEYVLTRVRNIYNPQELGLIKRWLISGEKVTNELFELTPGLPLREQAIAFLGIS